MRGRGPCIKLEEESKMVTYHIGFCKRGKTLIIQARTSVDCLSCEIYDYMGAHVTSKVSLQRNRYQILALAKAKRPDVYGSLRYAVVE